LDLTYPLGPNWAEARFLIHRILKNFRLGPVDFTTGSEFDATLGKNSVESKLSISTWTCTHDNFNLFADVVYQHRALKVAFRKRYAMWLADHKFDKRRTDAHLYNTYKNRKDRAREIFRFKLSRVVKFVHGNRFTSVLKNNLKDRPVCIEPFANILTQRRIGNGFRKSLKDFGIDLNITAEKHRLMISSPKWATIDLKNASDSILTRLCEYLLPRRVFNLVKQARSEMTLGLDDNFYFINKISSMGNGFTFELMSLILFALSYTYDKEASVFGDDIIIHNEYAQDLIANLEQAGFIVNRDKTHVNDVYRESCGAHFLDCHGYVESYDFRFPNNIGEVITVVNKLQRLARIYPSFEELLERVYRATPATLYANRASLPDACWRRSQDPFGAKQLDTWIQPCPTILRREGLKFSRSAKRKLFAWCKLTQNDPIDASLHLGFEWVDLASAPDKLKPSAWAKYFMYLNSGRRCKNTIRGKGTFKSFLCVTLSCGTTFRWSALSA